MHTPRLEALPPRDGCWFEVDIGRQCLVQWQGDRRLLEWPVSTALAGTGQREGSGCTPLGWHYVRAAIGHGQPPGTVFRGRRSTGEVYSATLAAAHPGRDWILTRILWLCGLERGINRGGDVDSQRRYIYLHGTPPDQPMGVPRSHGCIRMRDQALLEVFALALPGTPVWLHE
ncbi:L,D-transpeptidase [Halomonas sp. MCCC 1A17488]|uniref:L,D-transpeptidase n=1 Tax=Billgrantia sulfidoxydans TaxID=2733484 RepID=A0ABX7W5C0_9GAMM|nr:MULTISPECIES: L,D-transpeptidase [Halomonas]MCE8015346.1 L,D-transpeptidase [Halomonas sp. MCCC 1A17488]MCG3238679.1 L,D-transpeptidase [Halomonas sp. MCCC 1A17488]QPP51347.1 L,D-transpeptidase [Halomonas sp. SS10-MC5]QTP54902.1 L,D-transpeptidase [Halomonas sulfidoxydans]